MSSKILIVEDEPMISEDLAMIVSAAGYSVIGQAYDGATAMDMIYNRHPDIILLDISLDHQMSGIDIAEQINEKFQLPFIFITSFSDKLTLEKAKNVLPQGYIVKPFRKSDILTTLEIVAFRSQEQNKKTPYLTYDEVNLKLSDPITIKEYEILLDVVEGLSNEQISEKHFIALNTVKTHLKRTFVKMNIISRTQVALKLFRG